MAFFGDGGANQGVLHECMNLASVWKLPVIFCCENNGYAESTPVEYGLSVANVADRAAGYDMPGFHVDGMDVLAVYEAAGEAVSPRPRRRWPRAAGSPHLPLLRPHRL